MANNFGKAHIEVGGGDSYVSERECGGGGADRGQPLTCGNTGGHTAITGMYHVLCVQLYVYTQSHAVQYYDTYIIKLNALFLHTYSR